MEKYLTKKEVVKKYGISERTLAELRKKGLPSRKANPFSKSVNAKLVYPETELDEWFNKMSKENK